MKNVCDLTKAEMENVETEIPGEYWTGSTDHPRGFCPVCRCEMVRANWAIKRHFKTTRKWIHEKNKKNHEEYLIDHSLSKIVGLLERSIGSRDDYIRDFGAEPKDADQKGQGKEQEDARKKARAELAGSNRVLNQTCSNSVNHSSPSTNSYFSVESLMNNGSGNYVCVSPMDISPANSNTRFPINNNNNNNVSDQYVYNVPPQMNHGTFGLRFISNNNDTFESDKRIKTNSNHTEYNFPQQNVPFPNQSPYIPPEPDSDLVRKLKEKASRDEALERLHSKDDYKVGFQCGNKTPDLFSMKNNEVILVRRWDENESAILDIVPYAKDPLNFKLKVYFYGKIPNMETRSEIRSYYKKLGVEIDW